MMDDSISRQAAINALWKALYDYEDKTEKQFQESEELDVDEWILHRIFVQDMSDIDRKVILDLPSVQPEIVRCGDCMHNGSFDTDCPIDWSGKEYCSFAERREE